MPKQKPPPDQINVIVRFPLDLHAAAKDRAEAEDLNLSQLVRRAVRHYLDTTGTHGIVEHIDSDPHNNDPANLEIRTPKKGKQ